MGEKPDQQIKIYSMSAQNTANKQQVDIKLNDDLFIYSHVLGIFLNIEVLASDGVDDDGWTGRPWPSSELVVGFL